MSNFVHLHVHSYYSLLDGLSSPGKLVQTAKKHGMKALALTDHGVMYGAIEFYKACKKEGIKPLVGCEVYLAPKGRKYKTGPDASKYNHLILIAKNFDGYKNLMKLTTLAHMEGYYYKPRIDHELLKEYGKGLIATSACLQGEIPKAILNDNMEKAKDLITKYKSYFDDGDFYLEVQSHEEIPIQQEINEKIYKLAEETNTKVIATNDVHYANKENRYAHDVLLCIQTGKTMNDTDRLKYDGVFAMLSPGEMAESFKDHPEVISNTVEIADKCDLEIKLNQQLIPEFKTPNGETASEYLRFLCESGLEEKYANTDMFEVAKERLDYELNIIGKMGFSEYFLIVWDFIKYAKDNDIVVGPGRGSAAGSITAYTLHITDIDPLRYNLLFERFLNPSRISMPDIDIDFADDRREEVLNYVSAKYGHKNVAQIITFGTMGAKASIRDCGRGLGMSYSYVDKIAKMIPTKPGITITEAMKDEPELKQIYDELPEAKRLIDTALDLEGVVRHSSTHACAVVISEKDLTEYTPLQVATKGEDSAMVTQYSMKPIDNIGLLKMDFLGLKNLTILERSRKIIKRTKNIDIELKDLPIDCKKTFKMLTKAETVGIFQLESGGMRRYLKSLKPTVFEDIIAMVSLYRPGSLDMKVSGNRTMVDIYIDRKHGKLKASYLDPCLVPILEETYGVIIYQEQILKIAQEFAGYSLGEADLLRRAIGKKIKAELDAQKKVFISKSVEKGKDRALAEKLFSFIEPFARYGFNKSHAACYALISYQTAYFKAHYPVEFIAACMSCDIGNNDRLSILMEDAKRLNIEILPPSVNESLKNFTVTDDFKNIRFGLAAIKNIGEGPATAIIDARKKGGKFKDLEDFLIRLGSKFANRKVLESLAKCGALIDLISRNQVVENMEQILSFVKAVENDHNDSQGDLFEMIGGESSTKPTLVLNDVGNLSNYEKLKWEKELIGMYVSLHPLAEHKEYFEKKFRLINSLGRGDGNKNIKIAGIITSVKNILTKKGDKMSFVVIEDYTSSIELVIFNSIYKKVESMLRVDNIVSCEGKISFKDNFSGTGEDIKYLCNSLKIFDPNNIPKSESVEKESTSINTSSKKHIVESSISDYDVKLRLPKTVKMTDLVKIKKIFMNNKGKYSISLLMPVKEIEKYHTVKVPFSVDFNEDVHDEVDAVFTR